MSAHRMSVAFGLCLTAGLGCLPADSLEGSVEELFSLSFFEVRALKQGEVLRIEYRGREAGRTTKTCKLIVDTRGLDLGEGKRLRDELFQERVTLVRVGLSGEDFPTVVGGSLRFDSLVLEDGGEVIGDFDAGFETGHTINGTFAATIQELDLD